MTLCDVVHGHQQLSLFNAHYDERCFLPIHIYEGTKRQTGGRDPAPGQDAGWQGGGHVILKHVIGRIRRHWPKTHILLVWRFPLRSERSHGLVREKPRHRLRFRLCFL